MVDVAAILADAPASDASSAAAVRDRAAQVLRPPGALARLDDLAVWLAGWQRTDQPHVDLPEVIVFGGDHGVAGAGISAFPQETTITIRDAILAGHATVNALAASVGAAVRFVDVGVGRPTGDITREPALTPERFADSFGAGRHAVTETMADVLIIGEIGIGNTTAAAAVAASLYGGEAAEWTGRGTGISGDALMRKIRSVEQARSRVAGEPPMEILRQVGGSELAAMAGAFAEARLRSVPVILDGYIATAAAAALAEADSAALDNVVAGHRSQESGHRRLLDMIGKEPVLDLNMRLGEGTGALLAIPVLRAAVSAVLDVATFTEVGLADG